MYTKIKFLGICDWQSVRRTYRDEIVVRSLQIVNKHLYDIQL